MTIRSINAQPAFGSLVITGDLSRPQSLGVGVRLDQQNDIFVGDKKAGDSPLAGEITQLTADLQSKVLGLLDPSQNAVDTRNGDPAKAFVKRTGPSDRDIKTLSAPEFFAEARQPLYNKYNGKSIFSIFEEAH